MAKIVAKFRAQFCDPQPIMFQLLGNRLHLLDVSTMLPRRHMHVVNGMTDTD